MNSDALLSRLSPINTAHALSECNEEAIRRAIGAVRSDAPNEDAARDALERRMMKLTGLARYPP